MERTSEAGKRGPRKGRAGRQSGYSLIEMMVVMVILVVGMFPVLKLQYIAIRGHAYARERQEAIQIASNVAEMLRTRSLSLNDFRDGSNLGKDFVGVYPEIQTQSSPAACDSIKTDNLFSLTVLDGHAVASGDGPTSAYPINTNGLGPEVPSADKTKLETARAIYTVHYVAHPEVTRPGDIADPSLTRITVFVSWDSKDHGDQSVTYQGFDKSSYWNRQVVSTTFYLSTTLVR